MRYARAVSFAVASLSLAACGIGTSEPMVCTTIMVFGVAVTVRDSVTGAPAAAGAMLVAVDGVYRDSSSMSDGTVLRAVGDRPGTYDLTVRQAGYRNWSRSGVHVVEAGCHVATVELTALLQR